MTEQWPTSLRSRCRRERVLMASRVALSRVAHAEVKPAEQGVTSTT